MMPPPDDVHDLLAAYALGALDPHDIARAEELLNQRPELRGTLDELRAAADLLPYGLPTSEPPPALRQRVLDRATGQATPRAAPARTAQRPRWPMFALGSLAASAMLALALVSGQLVSTQAELSRSQAQIAAAEAHARRVALLAVQSPLAQLSGTSGRAVLGQIVDDTVLLAGLPPLPEGQVYQLWLIEGDGPPQDGGVFTIDHQGYGLLTLPPTPALQRADTFAITAEPGPRGSPGPTTPILAAGKRQV